MAIKSSKRWRTQLESSNSRGPPRPIPCVRVSLPKQSAEQYQVVIGGLHALEEVTLPSCLSLVLSVRSLTRFTDQHDEDLFLCRTRATQKLDFDFRVRTLARKFSWNKSCCLTTRHRRTKPSEPAKSRLIAKIAWCIQRSQCSSTSGPE